jgi:hypothetical protein
MDHAIVSNDGRRSICGQRTALAGLVVAAKRLLKGTVIDRG